MKPWITFTGIGLLLCACASTTPADPDSSYNRAEAYEAEQRALRDMEFLQDPFGWGAGRLPTQDDMLFGGALPANAPRR